MGLFGMNGCENDGQARSASTARQIGAVPEVIHQGSARLRTNCEIRIAREFTPSRERNQWGYLSYWREENANRKAISTN